MPKAVAHPTDSRLLERSREHVVKTAGECGLKLRQNYNREAPRLAIQIGRYAHARQFKRRSEEHTSELQSLMRSSYAVFCLKKKKKKQINNKIQIKLKHT